MAEVQCIANSKSLFDQHRRIIAVDVDHSCLPALIRCAVAGGELFRRWRWLGSGAGQVFAALTRIDEPSDHKEKEEKGQDEAGHRRRDEGTWPVMKWDPRRPGECDRD